MNEWYYSTVVPPNTAVLGTGEKPAVFRNGGIGREHNIKKPYLGLDMGGGIGRGGIVRDDCIIHFLKWFRLSLLHYLACLVGLVMERIRNLQQNLWQTKLYINYGNDYINYMVTMVTMVIMVTMVAMVTMVMITLTMVTMVAMVARW